MRSFNALPYLSFALALTKGKDGVIKWVYSSAITWGICRIIDASAPNYPKIYYTKALVDSRRRAMCIPPFGIFILEKYRHDAKILRHELCHWHQYKRLGLENFYGIYLTQSVLYGYNKMPLEIECRFEESTFCQTNYTQCYPKP